MNDTRNLRDYSEPPEEYEQEAFPGPPVLPSDRVAFFIAVLAILIAGACLLFMLTGRVGA